MVKKPIRNLHSEKQTPPRLFDVIVQDGKVDLEVKTDKNKYETIPWEDVVYQVEAAMQAATSQNQKLPQ